ncbi:MAG: four helix bundle protein [Candidatus Levybacteria bacterium]|nr:four helix bundle protein [Candidatus Levybacteria bacterium]
MKSIIKSQNLKNKKGNKKVNMTDKVVQDLINKTLRELAAPVKPKQKSRVWKDPKGYQYLGVWQNTALLRVLIRKFTLTLPLWERRLKAQLDDAARSQKRNIEEGWKRATTSEYLNFLGYSQGSLEEVKGDIRDAKTDGFLKSRPGSSLKDIGIDLSIFKGPIKGQAKGEPTESSHPYYKPLSTLKSQDLTYEMFIELINKTDFLLRRLVESLERKLATDQKYYQVERARIRDKFGS